MGRNRSPEIIDSHGRKRCSKCREYKPLREFCNASSTLDGKQGYCFECSKFAVRQWKEKHKKPTDNRGKYQRVPKLPLTQEQQRIKAMEYGWIPKGTVTRRCNKCKRLRVKEVINDTGTCAVCTRQQPKEAKAPGRPRKYKYRTESGRKRVFARTETYRANVKACKQRRRSRAKAGGSFTAKEWLALKQQYNYTCLCCMKQEPEITITADHIKPLSLGGANTIDNIQPLCMDCNTMKGAIEIDYRSNKIV